MKKILLLEDDEFLRDGLTEILTKEGYLVTAAHCITDAKSLIANDTYHLMIFDVMLPDGSGVALCSEVRLTDADTPILFLTAMDNDRQVVQGLDAGGDDYVTKPFRLPVFLSRVRALLRRRERDFFAASGLSVDTEHFTVKKDGDTVVLTPTEFRLLNIIISAGGNIVTRSSILSRLWDDAGNFIDDNTLSVHISRLREKIGAERIVTVRGVGYRWKD